MANGYGIQATIVPIVEALQAGDIDRSGGKRVILIVDSDPLSADTWSAIFRLHGYAVLTAYDGVSGFLLARQNSPDLLITGLTMLGMNGVKLAILVRNAVPQCKILLFAGQSADEMLAEAEAMGYEFQTVTRPVHPTKMLEQAAAWLQVA
jgi:DNA-binding response OmpR family regulator